MQFIDTRKGEIVSAVEAILKGTSSDGGFFLPQEMPKLTSKDFKDLQELSFNERFAYIAGLFFDEFSKENILEAVESVYSEDGYSLLEIDDGLHFLELWDESCSYEDICFPFLRALYDLCVKSKEPKGKTIFLSTKPEQISALANSFKNTPYAIVLAPFSATDCSKLKEELVFSVNGDNYHPFKVNAPTASIYNEIISVINEIKSEDNRIENVIFQSGNWGIILPLICCFISAYCDLLEEKGRKLKDFNITLSEGDYRCLIASYYAKKMGVPMYSIIGAGNNNCPLPDFLSVGIYKCHSNKKNISSVLDEEYPLWEILAFELCDRNYDIAHELYKSYDQSKSFLIERAFYKQGLFAGDCYDEEMTECISLLLDEYNYIADPSLALAYSVYCDYYEACGDERESIIVSLYNPFLFPSEVGIAITENSKDNIKTFVDLSLLTGETVPQSLEKINLNAKEAPAISVDELKESIKQIIKGALK